jgi:hypothetical protein
MGSEPSEAMLVIASEAELPAGDRIWGTGGWLAPDRREALDWLTLARVHGWGVAVRHREGPLPEGGWLQGNRWVVVACDPDSLREDQVALLASRLAQEPLLLVARAGAAGAPWALLAGAANRPGEVAGKLLHWLGPGPERRWHCRKELQAGALDLAPGTVPWATLAGAPVIAARRVGRGAVATLAFHPSRIRDEDGTGTVLLRHLLIWGAELPVAWLDLEGSLVLRMDDPGGAQNVYSKSWSYPKLGEDDWASLGTELHQRNARLSIGYVAGWVDDGDATRGHLEVDGRKPPRVPGQVYPSPLVKYSDRAGNALGRVHDYEAEYRGIQALRAAGRGDVELHGYTHLHPDTLSWARAPDRYEAECWYRELGAPAVATLSARPAAEHPLALGMAALERFFGTRPTTLICPGDQWTNAALERALDLGLWLVGSYYLAVRDGRRFCWCQHVCAPYLDEPDAAWFEAGLPVVGYFHDREVALEGTGWVSHWLDRWRECGARRLLDFRELASAVGRQLQCEDRGGAVSLAVRSPIAPLLVRPLRIAFRRPGSPLPAQVVVTLDHSNLTLPVQPRGDGVGCVELPLDSVAGG